MRYWSGASLQVTLGEACGDEMRLRIEGLSGAPCELDFASLVGLPGQVADVGSYLPGRDGRGVWLRAVLDSVGTASEAAYLTIAAADGRFAVSVPLAAVADAAVVVYGRGSGPLPVEAGGPIRLYILPGAVGGAAGGVDACANVKNLGLLRLTRAREPDIGHSHG